MMKSSIPPVLIIDLEVNPQTRQIFQIGALRPDTGEEYESAKLRGQAALEAAFARLEKMAEGAEYLLGHNIIGHDLPVLAAAAPHLRLHHLPAIDTLRLSPLAFPQNPYHRLIKNHKLIASALNSPLADCYACLQLFNDQCAAFAKLRETAPQEFAVYGHLFGALPFSDGLKTNLFSGKVPMPSEELKKAVLQMMTDTQDSEKSLRVCMTRMARLRSEDLADTGLHIPLAYALSWLKVSGGNSVLAPWVRYQFPETERLIRELRDQDCGNPHCRYCRDTLNPTAQLIRYFGSGKNGNMTSFRKVENVPGGQEAIVREGMKGGHLLAVLPTGGGKSLCFQLPALNRYFRNGGLTIVVSPLQSLMTDQVYNLQRRGIGGVATLNGMLSVPERSDVLDKIALGDVGILFVAPEQFRNTSFIKAIEHRQINGWVFDEAHCLSKWGHDFRPDYLYAAKFIKSRLPENGAPAPISCFTATAKPDVLNDILGHFREELGIEFKQFIGSNERTNLFYEVLDTPRESKNQRIHELLSRELDGQNGGAVVFAASRKRTEEISEFLKAQQWACSHFHAGLKSNEKADIQEQFINGGLRVIVATNAFGMGVDKPDVRLVIHAEIPGSLENYLQEAGRAGRDQQAAKCILLFDRQDIDTQFRLNKSSQLERKDLALIWGRLKSMGKAEELVVSSGEILRDGSEYMSFDADDSMADTKVKTAVAWLERAELLNRTENRTRIFPARSGRLNLEQALDKIKHAGLPQRKRELFATVTEIIYNAQGDELISTDHLGSLTGCSYLELQGMLQELEKIGVLTNDTHITVNVRTDTSRPSEKRLRDILFWEEILWQVLHEQIPDADSQEWQNLSLSALAREINLQNPENQENIRPDTAKLMLFALAQDKDAVKHSTGSLNVRDYGNDILKVRFKDKSDSWENLEERAALRRRICAAVLAFLIGKTGNVRSKDAVAETTFGELKNLLADDLDLAAHIPEEKREILLNQAMLFMHKLDVFKLNQGMTVLRHAMTIRLNQDAVEAKIKYLQRDYQPLQDFYGEKRFQVHVMLEYAKKALENIGGALKLVNDYFRSEEKDFKHKWFKGRLKELEENVSQETFDHIVGSLNEQQRAVVTDKSTQNRLVLAGPGSGKTRVIVARVAYLLKVQHIDPAAIIVLTFNRHAAQEIKRRLFDLAGSMAAAVTVLTYDSMAMRLLGVRFDQNSDKKLSEADLGRQLETWCLQAAELLSGNLAAHAGEDSGRDNILAGFRYILVDEYQDITERHYKLVSALAGRQMDEDNKLTLLAVGDDDQNIYAFNGSSNEYIHRFCEDYGVKQPDFLTLNYRSSQHIITAANAVISGQEGRLKTRHPIVINPERQQQSNGGIWAEKDPERQGRVRVITLPQHGTRRQKNNIQAQAAAAEILRLAALGADTADMAVLAHRNETLESIQAWCEQNNHPYCKKNPLRLSRLRQFVRLIEALEKKNSESENEHSFTVQQFESLLRQQKVCGKWQRHFQTMAEDFKQEHAASTTQADESREVHYSSAYLKSWLYEYTGESDGIRSKGLYIGTVHSAKGLEFKHVFILDGDWEEKSPDKQRLYYVGMTRAIETLTLIRHSPHHAWIAKLPPEVEHIEQHFETDAALDTKYSTLSLTQLDIGFAGRDRQRPANVNNIRYRLQKISDLETGDPLQIRRNGDTYEFMAGSEVVVRTAKNADIPPLPAGTEAYVADFYVRYREQVDEHYAAMYPENLPKWAVVIPKIIIKPDYS